MTLLEDVLRMLPVGDVCLDWPGYRTWEGYGAVTFLREGRKTTTTAHRAVWVALYGPIAEGLQVDHTCYRPPCVNPEHLRLLTPYENRARIHRTVCRRGHPFDESNTYWTPDGRARRCRRCDSEKAARRYRARKGR